MPKFGFYGIVASYYASNVMGNCARFIKIMKHTETPFRPFKIIVVPVIYAFLTMGTTELITRLVGADGEKIPEIIFFVLLWGLAYFGIFVGFGKVKSFRFSDDKLLCNFNK